MFDTNRNDLLRNMPEEEREKRNEFCQRCRIRKDFAKMDFHFGWQDCPYDCKNDFEHWEEENRMTYKEALEILDTIPTIGDQVDALEMAIQALEEKEQEAKNGES